jgi:hypothetical protein
MGGEYPMQEHETHSFIGSHGVQVSIGRPARPAPDTQDEHASVPCRSGPFNYKLSGASPEVS